MQRSSKRVTRRNDTKTRRTRGKSHGLRGLAFQVVVVFGCLWIVACLGFAAWYVTIRLNGPSQKLSTELVGVQRLKEARNKLEMNLQSKLSFLNRKRLEAPRPILQAEEVVETAAPQPQTGVKHIPNLLPLSRDPDAYRSPTLIFSCKRPGYLSQTLDDILMYMGDHCGFGCPIIVSEDGSHSDMLSTIQQYTTIFQQKGIPLIHFQHDQAKIPEPTGGLRKKVPLVFAYQALAQHYGWALREVFNGMDPSLPTPERVVILEEDIHIAPDFFSYMKATSRILDEDSTLLAVSAYNDNGHKAKDHHRILRSDFFPGLGWMMTRKLWKEELEAKWPRGYWDDWLRDPDQRRNRHILRPEVSRTFHFGNKGGTSHNQFGSILSRVILNKEPIDWTKQDLSYLHQDSFDAQYMKLLAEAVPATNLKEGLVQVAKTNTRVEYSSIAQFKKYAERLDIMDDEKAMVPRTAYKGVVEVRMSGGNILFLTPTATKLKQSFPGM